MGFRILQLVGSAFSDFYCDLSRLYARDCIDALADSTKYTFLIAYITPDGQWRFPVSLHDSDIRAASSMPLSAAIAHLSELSIDLALPQMFCIPGMTKYRALLELLEIPFIGNLPMQMAIAADKAKAKAIVSAAGVKVHAGELLRVGDWPTLSGQAVVKPNAADNSLGITLVEQPQDYAAALKNAFEYSSEVMVEEYIELGREVRCGVVEQNGELICLPLQEYRVDSQKKPIRLYGDKLKKNIFDTLDLTSKEGNQSWMVSGDDPDVPAVWEAAVRCYGALGCRHYGLFDFRIDACGQPWFLEAGLYCSFAPKSVVVSMMDSAGTPLSVFFEQAVQMCLAESCTEKKTLVSAF